MYFKRTMIVLRVKLERLRMQRDAKLSKRNKALAIPTNCLQAAKKTVETLSDRNWQSAHRPGKTKSRGVMPL
jgi:ubiquinone biosynthesis protein COQ9